MSEAAPIPDAQDAPDPAIARTERWLAALQETTEIALRMMRRLESETEAAPAGAPAGTARAQANPVSDFARLARAVRLTVALGTRTELVLRDLSTDVTREREARRAEAAKRAEAETAARKEARKAQVRDLVTHVIEREGEDEETMSDILQALDERLDEDEAYRHIEDLPLRDVVEHLCADLQLTPDWSRWTGCDWGPPEPFFRPALSIYGRPSRRMIDDAQASGP